MNNSSSESTSVAKRPPTRQRKSTLTQQQKNKKRQRATPQQLNILKSEFDINQTPNAKTREEIGRRIDMTERSVQIWFQNKRAKNKLLAKKHGSGFPTNVQFSMGAPYYGNPGMMAHLANTLHPHSIGANFPPTFVGNNMANFGNFNPLFQGQMGGVSGVPILTKPGGAIDNHPTFSSPNIAGSEFPLSCASLTIGSWRRIITPENNSNDLRVTFSMADSFFTYTMFANSTGFRMRFSLKSVKSLEFTPHADNPNIGDVNITLFHPPAFAIQTAKLPAWIQCEDFSEMKQASVNLVHRLTGPSAQLQSQLARISLSDASKEAMRAKSPFLMPGPISSPAGTNIVMRPGIHQTLSRPSTGTMSESSSPLISASQLDGNIVLGMAMGKSRSKSLPSLIVNDNNTSPDQSLDDDDDDDQYIDVDYDSSLDSATASHFFLNEDMSDGPLSSMSTPDMDNLVSNDQATTMTFSNATSPADSIPENKTNGMKIFTPSVANPLTAPTMAELSDDILSSVSMEDVASALSNSSNLMDSSLLGASSDDIVGSVNVQSNTNGSTAVSPMAQPKTGNLLDGYSLNTNLYSGNSDMMINADDNDDKEYAYDSIPTGKLLMATSANFLDLDSVTGTSETEPGNVTNNNELSDFDKVLENFSGDSPLLSLIQV